MSEIWKDIPGYVGFYQISNLGNVRSLKRKVNNSGNGTQRETKEMLMNPWDNGNGYLVVSLQKNHKRKNHYVHRLVACAYVNNPDNLGFVNHLDFNKHNNAASNLEWCTQRENVNYSKEHMKKPKSNYRMSNTGEKYISRRVRPNGEFAYAVSISSKDVYKWFASLEDAISFRNGVIQA